MQNLSNPAGVTDASQKHSVVGKWTILENDCELALKMQVRVFMKIQSLFSRERTITSWKATCLWLKKEKKHVTLIFTFSLLWKYAIPLTSKSILNHSRTCSSCENGILFTMFVVRITSGFVHLGEVFPGIIHLEHDAVVQWRFCRLYYFILPWWFH